MRTGRRFLSNSLHLIHVAWKNVALLLWLYDGLYSLYTVSQKNPDPSVTATRTSTRPYITGGDPCDRRYSWIDILVLSGEARGFEWGVVKPEGLKFEAEGRERGWGSWGSPPDRGLGEHCAVSSPSGVRGGAPTANAFWVNLGSRKRANGCKRRLFSAEKKFGNDGFYIIISDVGFWEVDSEAPPTS